MKLNMTRRRTIISIVGLVLVLIWLLWPDRQLARVRALQRDLANEALPQEERDKKRSELRQAMGNLSQAQRREMFADGRQRGNQEMERYHNLTPAEKKKYLDQMIDRQQQMQQRQQQPTAAPPGAGQRPGNQNRPPSTADDRERRRQQQLDHSTPRERELRDQFRRDMEDRRKQRGLPPSQPGRPGRP